MPFNFQLRGDQPTNTEKLLRVLGDNDWHSTRELTRRVSHCFAAAKFKLLELGYPIEKQYHPSERYQYRYRLVRERIR